MVVRREDLDPETRRLYRNFMAIAYLAFVPGFIALALVLTDHSCAAKIVAAFVPVPVMAAYVYMRRVGLNRPTDERPSDR